MYIGVNIILLSPALERFANYELDMGEFLMDK